MVCPAPLPRPGRLLSVGAASRPVAPLVGFPSHTAGPSYLDVTALSPLVQLIHSALSGPIARLSLLIILFLTRRQTNPSRPPAAAGDDMR